MTKKLLSYFALAIATILLVVACSSDTQLRNDDVTKSRSSENADVLQIWWDKGYIIQEDEAIERIVNNWQKISNQKADLKFYTPDEIAQRTQRAIQAGKAPDVLFSSRAEYPLLAWQGKLADVSDVVQPTKQNYTDISLKAAYLFNNLEKKRSYYGVPLHQGTIHIFYWKNILKQANKNSADIPQTWNEFWQFWQRVQTQLRPKQPDIYALGIPYSTEASDTYYLFEQILEAYNVAMFDAEGNLQVDDASVRQNIIDCLAWYARFYQQGYVPPSSLSWLDPDNNRSFLNRQVIMTPNPTLSIASAIQTKEDAAIENLGTMEFPDRPDGSPITHLVSVRQAVIPAESKNQAVAKDFLTFLIQPEVIGNYLKSAGGRYLPAMEAARQDSFWTNQHNPHVATATKTLTEGQTKLFYSARYPVYSLVLEQNIWGQALHSIVVDKISPEQAADKAIAQIEAIFDEWEK